MVFACGLTAFVAYDEEFSDHTEIVGPGDVISGYYLMALPSNKGLGIVVPSLCAVTASSMQSLGTRNCMEADQIMGMHRWGAQLGIDPISLTLRFIPALDTIKYKKFLQSFLTVEDLYETTGGRSKVERNCDRSLKWTVEDGVLWRIAQNRQRHPVSVADESKHQIIFEVGVVKATYPGYTTVDGNVVGSVDPNLQTEFTVHVPEKTRWAWIRLLPPPNFTASLEDLYGNPRHLVGKLLDMDTYANIRLFAPVPQEFKPFVPFKRKAVIKLRAYDQADKRRIKRSEVAQIKFDGIKVFLHVKDKRVKLYSKRGNDITRSVGRSFAESNIFHFAGTGDTAYLVAQLPDCILDGEYIRSTGLDNVKIGDKVIRFPIRSRHNAPRSYGKPVFVVYDCAYWKNSNVAKLPYDLRLAKIRLPEDPIFFVDMAFKLPTIEEDRLQWVDNFIKTACRGGRLEGLVLRRNDTGYGTATLYAIKPNYVTPVEVVVQLLGIYYVSRMEGTGQSMRLVFGTQLSDYDLDRGKRNTGPSAASNHPWHTYVPVFTHAVFGSSGLSAAVRRSCLSTPLQSVVPPAAKGPLGLVTSIARPSPSSPRYAFNPEAVYAFSDPETASGWYPVEGYLHITGGGRLANGMPLTAVDDINKRVRSLV